jgi:quercetin dioxygenase-like cupin family protein
VEGKGELIEAGSGGPQLGEAVIHVESPYRFQTVASAFETVPRIAGHSEPDVTHCVMVINGTRLFQIDALKVESAHDLIVNVYLSERFDDPLPQGEMS